MSSTAAVHGGLAYPVVPSAGTVRALDAVTSEFAHRLRGLLASELADAVRTLDPGPRSRRYRLADGCPGPGRASRARTERFVGGSVCDGATRSGTCLAVVLPFGLPGHGRRSAELRFPRHVASNLRMPGRGAGAAAYLTLLPAFAVLLGSHTDEREPVISRHRGSTTGCRYQSHRPPAPGRAHGRGRAGQ
ncbi:hypothetical protein AB0I77_20900 [Streptomyces sp. NPDC050619]|uniref:hypothetical protein n=1 Tax=Streptomyces sp. NPDC050619 TaxID=3157214 RepID=UPI0034313D11